MSSFEMAHKIVDQMNEEQLQGFISLFGGMFKNIKKTFSKKDELSVSLQEKKDLDQRQKAFDTLEKLCRHVPNIDEKRELEEYRNQRYGI